MDTELSEAQWEIIRRHIPPPKNMGRPPNDAREVLNGILWVLKTGARWEDMPRRYGHPSTCWRRLRQWERVGVWKRILEALLSTLDSEGRLHWEQACLDASFAPAKRGAMVSG